MKVVQVSLPVEVAMLIEIGKKYWKPEASKTSGNFNSSLLDAGITVPATDPAHQLYLLAYIEPQIRPRLNCNNSFHMARKTR